MSAGWAGGGGMDFEDKVLSFPSSLENGAQAAHPTFWPFVSVVFEGEERSQMAQHFRIFSPRPRVPQGQEPWCWPPRPL